MKHNQCQVYLYNYPRNISLMYTHKYTAIIFSRSIYQRIWHTARCSSPH